MMETTTTVSCCWASGLLCLRKLPARATQQIPSFVSNAWCILFESYPRHESLECCECCHKSGVSAATRRLENLKAVPHLLDTHHSGSSSVLQGTRGICAVFPKEKPHLEAFSSTFVALAAVLQPCCHFHDSPAHITVLVRKSLCHQQPQEQFTPIQEELIVVTTPKSC